MRNERCFFAAIIAVAIVAAGTASSESGVLAHCRAEEGAVRSVSISFALEDSAPALSDGEDEATRSALMALLPTRTSFVCDVTDLDASPTSLTRRVEFPSPLPSGDAVVDHCIATLYMPRNVEGNVPGIVILHHLQDDIRLERNIARRLAQKGVASMIVLFPGYGTRKSEDGDLELFASDVPATLKLLRQSIADVRRAVTVMRSMPGIDRSRVGILGVSLGAIIGSAAAGVDGGSFKTMLVMGGGDLAAITMTPSRETRSMRQKLAAAGIDESALRAAIAPVDPITFAKRIPGKTMLSFTAEGDNVVPPACHAALMDRIEGETVHRWPGNHYTMPMARLGEIIDLSVEFISRPIER